MDIDIHIDIGIGWYRYIDIDIIYSRSQTLVGGRSVERKNCQSPEGNASTKVTLRSRHSSRDS